MQQPKDSSKADEEEEPDIDAIMVDLRVVIEKIYIDLYKNKNKTENDAALNSALQAKKPIEILQEIELKLNDHMRLIKHIYDDDEYGKDFHHKVDKLVAHRSQVKKEMRNQ